MEVKDKQAKEAKQGVLKRIAGPVVTAVNLDAHMYDVVKVGKEALMGEVIKIQGDNVIIQVYEDTSGIRPGEPVENTGLSLAVELGPGLLTSIYDGIQRPLAVLVDKMGNFIQRGVSAPGLSHTKKWGFKPLVKSGDKVEPGAILGEVQETNIVHKVMLPPNAKPGKVKTIKSGDFTVDEIICVLEDGREYPMIQRWPVRVPRPVKEKMNPTIPLITGQRILDGLFPIAKGGTAAIPGPFGSGKTVTQQQAGQVVGCRDRGLHRLRRTRQRDDRGSDGIPASRGPEDPESPSWKGPCLSQIPPTCPVAAREASVYTGITIAEYFRDMGYDVSLMADSTSRWAEAMREISSRLEEMPGEEGYPAYLAARLSEFYERAGLVKTLNGARGSVSVIGAVSPPGGDFSEPVTQNTLRIVKVFWALDAKLSQRRHFPAINWLNSYSLYLEALHDYYDKEVSPEWNNSGHGLWKCSRKRPNCRRSCNSSVPTPCPNQNR